MSMINSFEDENHQLLSQMDQLTGDVPVMLRAELAQTKLTFSELLGLEVGDIIRLSRSTGENIDVFAEDVLIGWGEVLMIDGVLTTRIADIRNARLPDLEDDQQATNNLPTNSVTKGELHAIPG